MKPTHMEQPELFAWKPRPVQKDETRGACEWKIVALRETAPDELPMCDVPVQAVSYWREHIATAAHFNSEVECFAVLLLNTKLRLRGHHLVSIGCLNEAMAHPREVFRAAVIGAAYGVVLMHNHPSGEVEPSSSDVRMTKLLVEAGRIVQIEVIDHIIVGHERHCSFRELGII